jgi:hypothetical protein
MTNQTLLIGLQPRRIVTQNFIDKQTADGIYMDFFAYLHGAIGATYGLVDTDITPGEGHEFYARNLTTKIFYKAIPICETTRGETVHNAYRGALVIEEPKVDLANASRLITTTLVASVLDSHESTPAIKLAKGKKVISEGSKLLNQLGISLEEICEFRMLPCAAAWCHQKL